MALIMAATTSTLQYSTTHSDEIEEEALTEPPKTLFWISVHLNLLVFTTSQLMSVLLELVLLQLRKQTMVYKFLQRNEWVLLKEMNVKKVLYA